MISLAKWIVTAALSKFTKTDHGRDDHCFTPIGEEFEKKENIFVNNDDVVHGVNFFLNRPCIKSN